MKNAEVVKCSVLNAANDAARQIPPVWPLASYVAVNPFLGQANETLAQAGQRLGQIGGVPVFMPRSWYQDRIASGRISGEDLAAALSLSTHQNKPDGVEALKAAAAEAGATIDQLPTVADLAAKASGTDWPGLIAERFGCWAAGYFDEGQALWAAPSSRRAWAAYCAHATHDLTPEIMGLAGFARFASDAPRNPVEMINRAVERLGLGETAQQTHFHQLLFGLGGWAQYGRFQQWQAELANGTNQTILDLLAIRLLWEEALFEQYKEDIESNWADVITAHEASMIPSAAGIVDEILQEAAEHAAQRELADRMNAPIREREEARPALQAVFCIDVRSEIFRRSLEAVEPSIQTLGFAGFFGVFTKHRRFASDVQELRLPVLVNPSVESTATEGQSEQDDLDARYTARSKRAWGRFKLAAVSSFAFVEAMGPVYIARLVRDALGLSPATVPDDPAPRFDPSFDLDSRVGAAETVLNAMSLTSGFARIVLLTGHGANVVNNPFASGLQCGACGGYSGEVNARLLASLLNDSRVRTGLGARGIEIPEDTLFVAALHDTTTDRVKLYDKDSPIPGFEADLMQVRDWLEAAGKVTRGERALSLPRATNPSDIAVRARDWAEIRPEWALAGCSALIVAPRTRTAGRKLEGRAFLHDYDWRKDGENGFGVLELIMTAPVVVASWISLQYYGSTVAPNTFGSGNKLLHNVVGGIGVFEGNGGVMRAGLPWQSVHDSERYIHEPLRLSVCIEAPRDAMAEILERHPDVRALFDNRWLHLFAMDDSGRLAHRYVGNLMWEPTRWPSTTNSLRDAA